MRQGNLRACAAAQGERHVEPAGIDASGTQVGTIDNVSFIGGKATQVVIGYNATMGMGGNKLAVSYDLLQKMGHGSIVDFKLSDAQTARFEVYSKAVN